MKRCQRYGEQAALLLLDLDDLKLINDGYGHKVGDDVLRAVARAIKARVRRSDSVARLGGDEFAVLMLHADRGTTEALVATCWRRSPPARCRPVDGRSVPRQASDSP